MANLALAFDILAKDKNASKTFDKVGDSAERAGKKGSAFGDLIKKGLAVASVAVAGAGAAITVAGVKAAADLQQSIGGVDAVFKKNAKQVHTWAKSASRDVGLSQNSYSELATLIGSQLKNAGVSIDKLGAKTNDVIEIGADLSAMYGGTASDAVEALSSALKGEMDPIEKYGISLNQAAIQAEAMRLGLVKGKGALSQSAKAQAILSLVTKQGADAQGAFGRESDTLAHKQQVLGAQFEDIKATIGTALLPVLTTMAGFISDKVVPAVADFIKQMETGEGVGGRVRRVLDDITGAVKTVLTWGKKDLFPALKDAYNTVLPGVKGALDPIWQRLQDIAGVTWGKLQSGIDALKSLTTMDFSNIDAKKLGAQLGTALVDGLSGLAKVAGKITDALGKLFGKVDWVGIGITVGKQVPAILLGLAAGILNFDFGSLLSGIKDHWGEILLGVLAIAFSPSKLVGPLAKILTKIPFVGRFLAAAVTWLNELGGKLTHFAGDLFKTFWRGFSNSPIPGAGFVVRFVKSLAGLPGKLHGFLVSIQTRLGVWALDAFEAMGRGARSAIGGLLKFVALLPIRILRAVGSLARLLFPRGYEAVAGMARGIAGRIGGLLSTVRGIPGKILSAIGDLAGKMVGKGEDIVRGIIRGIGNMGGQLKDFVVQFVKDHIPGPVAKALGIKSPSTVMRDEIGRWIPLGVVEGIRATRGQLDREVASLTQIPAASVDGARVGAVQGHGVDAFDYERFGQAVARALAAAPLSVPVSSIDRAVVGRIA